MHTHGAFSMPKNARRVFRCVNRAFASYRQVKNHSGIKGLRNRNPFFHTKNQIKKGGKTMKRCWKNWIKAAGIRALKTVAQTAVATIGTSAVLSEVNWLMVGSASLLAGVLSLLTSLAGIPEECPEEDEGTDAE